MATKAHFLVHPEDIFCSINIQHNCSSNKCTISAAQPQYLEREKQPKDAPAVQHINPDNLILNIAKIIAAAYWAGLQIRGIILWSIEHFCIVWCVTLVMSITVTINVVSTMDLHNVINPSASDAPPSYEYYSHLRNPSSQDYMTTSGTSTMLFMRFRVIAMEEVVVQMLNLKLMNPSGDHRRGNKFGHIVKVNILRAVPAQRPPAAYKIQRHLLTLKAPLSIHQQGQHKYSATGSKRNNAMTGLLQLAILLQTQQQITSLNEELQMYGFSTHFFLEGPPEFHFLHLASRHSKNIEKMVLCSLFHTIFWLNVLCFVRTMKKKGQNLDLSESEVDSEQESKLREEADISDTEVAQVVEARRGTTRRGHGGGWGGRASVASRDNAERRPHDQAETGDDTFFHGLEKYVSKKWKKYGRNPTGYKMYFDPTFKGTLKTPAAAVSTSNMATVKPANDTLASLLDVAEW
ncbi:hypothetical protein SERLADRAFT_409449 [Serpula lacrymans var. lacrymans S7.9]|uniref:Uncharacterized protein n=1 Tax=Serpula lacrymans var. lacrymans (strain S7.9) TaxID=578457 RepID=F8P1A1_SERL9|nr:uncharacterized protein SERLADRAFT_409449 [Serpula lacrymans var. lacrymans S7.9]EGO22932.1 hypothetical protein SERLADRAFT_409449 [Serpula lacrymans var. lacrymans S7.9]